MNLTKRHLLWAFVIFGLLANAIQAAEAGRKYLNIDFAGSNDNGKTGLAATGGGSSDYWNFYDKFIGGVIGEPNGLRWSDNTLSGVQLAVTPGLGSWGTGSSDPMLHSYLYTFGASRITAELTAFPASTVDVYFYAHGLPGSENGVVTLVVNGVSKGQKSTTTIDAWDATGWTEGNEYVVFRGVAVPAGATIQIHSDPGVAGKSVINGAQIVATFGAPPSITTQPADLSALLGTIAVFEVTAAGPNLQYQWRRGSENLVATDRVIGVTSARLEISGLRLEDAGKYSVVVRNEVQDVPSREAVLTVTQQRRLLNVDYGDVTEPRGLGPAVVGINPDDYWNLWDRDSQQVTEAVSGLKWSDGSVAGARLTVLNAEGLWLTTNVDKMFRTYVYPLSRTGNVKSSFTAFPAGTYDIYVYAHGAVPNENAVVQLLVNGVAIGEKSTSSLENWDGPDWTEGNEFVIFRSVPVTVNDVVEVVAKPGLAELAVINGIQFLSAPIVGGPPHVTQQPVGGTYISGTGAALLVRAEGSGTLHYQWKHAGTNLVASSNILGVDGPELTLSNLQMEGAGEYFVEVSSQYGEVSSDKVMVVVTDPPPATGIKLLNVNYGLRSQPIKTGKAAIGLSDADYWNLYDRDSASVTDAANGLRWHDGSNSGAMLEVQNAAGAWNTFSTDPMLLWYLYPSGRTGNIESSFSGLTPASYDIYVYSHGQPPNENGVVEVLVGGVSLGEKSTSSSTDWDGPGWTESNEYVVFRNVSVSANAPLVVRAKPGQSGLAVINGIQLLSGAVFTGPATIVQQPVSTTKYVGEKAGFSVIGQGGGSLSVQWQHAGTNLVNSERITGATSWGLSINNVQPGDAGVYKVLLSNEFGNAPSVEVTLTVLVDDAAPVVTIASPVAGPAVSESYVLEGTVTENHGLANVRWERNGVMAGNLTINNSNFRVPGLKFDPGENRIKVIATDVSGNQTSQEVIVTWVVPRSLTLGAPPAQQEGTRITVPLTLSSTGSVGGATFVVSFNTNNLADPQFEWSGAVVGGLTSWNLEAGKAIRATFALSGVSLPSGTITLAQVSFRLRSVAQNLQTPIGLEVVGINNEEGDPYPTGNYVRSTAATITKRKIIADNNANNRLDVGDASLILRLVSRLDPVRSWDRSLNDLNNNFDVDAGDATKVLRAVVGLDPQPTVPGLAPAGKKAVAAAVPPANVPGLFVSDKATAVAGEKITIEVRISNQTKPVSGASFRVEYPADALRLENSSAHVVGGMVPVGGANGAVSVWNVAPGQNNYAMQNGAVSLAVSSASSWANNNGVLARLTFTVQAGAAARYGWPVALKNLEVSRDGFQTELLGDSLFTFTGHPPGEVSLKPSVTFGLDGKPRITLQGDAGAWYLIEGSSDLKTWNTVGSYYSDSGSVEFEDSLAAGAEARFYRATLVPN